MASQTQGRNIPYMWDIFSPKDGGDSAPVNKSVSKMTGGDDLSTGHDSAISVGSVSDDDLYINKGVPGLGANSSITAGGTISKKKKRFGGVKNKDSGAPPCGKEDGGETEVKYLERHLSMKKTIRKKIMRDLQKAFVEDPNEFRVEDIPPEQKAEINLQSLSFGGAGGKKKDKKSNESNFLDFLRGGGGGGSQGEGKGLGANSKNTNNGRNNSKGDNNFSIMMAISASKNNKDVDGDSGHGSPAAEESEEEDKGGKTSFWRKFTMKGNRNKR